MIKKEIIQLDLNFEFCIAVKSISRRIFELSTKNFSGSDRSRSRPYYYYFHAHDEYDFVLNMRDMY